MSSLEHAGAEVEKRLGGRLAAMATAVDKGLLAHGADRGPRSHVEARRTRSLSQADYIREELAKVLGGKFDADQDCSWPVLHSTDGLTLRVKVDAGGGPNNVSSSQVVMLFGDEVPTTLDVTLLFGYDGTTSRASKALLLLFDGTGTARWSLDLRPHVDEVEVSAFKSLLGSSVSPMPVPAAPGKTRITNPAAKEPAVDDAS